MMTRGSTAAWTPCTCQTALLQVLCVVSSRMGHSSWGYYHGCKQPWRALHGHVDCFAREQLWMASSCGWQIHWPACRGTAGRRPWWTLVHVDALVATTIAAAAVAVSHPRRLSCSQPSRIGLCASPRSTLVHACDRMIGYGYGTLHGTLAERPGRRQRPSSALVEGHRREGAQAALNRRARAAALLTQHAPVARLFLSQG